MTSDDHEAVLAAIANGINVARANPMPDKTHDTDLSAA